MSLPCSVAVWTELSVWSQCLVASTGGKRGRVHPGNHRLAAEKLLGCWHPGLHRSRVNRQINICCCLKIERREEGKEWMGRGLEGWHTVINHGISGFFDRFVLHKHRWAFPADIPAQLVRAAHDINRKIICVCVCRMWMCAEVYVKDYLCVRAHVYTLFPDPPCLCTVTVAMTSSWRHVLTVRPPKSAPWWPRAAVSCCPKVSEDILLHWHVAPKYFKKTLLKYKKYCMCRCVSCSRKVMSDNSRALQHPFSPLQGTPFHSAPISHAFRALPPVPRGPELHFFCR